MGLETGWEQWCGIVPNNNTHCNTMLYCECYTVFGVCEARPSSQWYSVCTRLAHCTYIHDGCAQLRSMTCNLHNPMLCNERKLIELERELAMQVNLRHSSWAMYAALCMLCAVTCTMHAVLCILQAATCAMHAVPANAEPAVPCWRYTGLTHRFVIQD